MLSTCQRICLAILVVTLITYGILSCQGCSSTEYKPPYSEASRVTVFSDDGALKPTKTITEYARNQGLGMSTTEDPPKEFDPGNVAKVTINGITAGGSKGASSEAFEVKTKNIALYVIPVLAIIAGVTLALWAKLKGGWALAVAGAVALSIIYVMDAYMLWVVIGGFLFILGWAAFESGILKKVLNQTEGKVKTILNIHEDPAKDTDEEIKALKKVGQL